uniref:Uncharacterized protein n=1 Tax=Zea mays TaxID=4577 RepID=C4J3S1_MAIZE|nr:unknown [Zea mays]ACR36667.1 unknown [Zea mays]
MRETIRAGVPEKMCWKSQTKEACISAWTRARTPCRSSYKSVSRICSVKLWSSRMMSTIEEKARPTAARADSPALSTSRSSHRPCSSCCCFLRLSIRRDSGSPTLLALRSTLAGHPQPPAPGC